MSDNRNTILAVILSGLVLIAWQYFYNVPAMEKQRAAQQATELAKSAAPAANPANPQATPQAGGAPTANAPAQPTTTTAVVSRDDAIAAGPRVKIDTPTLTGSIALKGARIDDLSLVQFRETVDPASPAIVLYSPSGTANPYYAEFGWVGGAGSTVKIPDQNTVWQQEGSGNLTPSTPGDAEIRQRRRPDFPPHHFDRRPLPLHHQGRRQQCRQRAGHAVSVCVDLAARHPAGCRLLHPA